jgi:hypothetical protein
MENSGVVARLEAAGVPVEDLVVAYKELMDLGASEKAALEFTSHEATSLVASSGNLFSTGYVAATDLKALISARLSAE